MINGEHNLFFFTRDKREKHHIKFSDDGTVSYKEKSKYEFERSLSVGPDTEKVTVVNLAVAVSIQKCLGW